MCICEQREADRAERSMRAAIHSNVAVAAAAPIVFMSPIRLPAVPARHPALLLAPGQRIKRLLYEYDRIATDRLPTLAALVRPTLL